MPAWNVTFETFLKWLGACAGLGTLAYAIYNMLLAQTRASGMSSGSAKLMLRTPFLVIATVIFLVIGIILWEPLPLQPKWQLRLFALILGATIYFASLALYLWGLHSLGDNFNASSGFGIRLLQGHQLVIRGPYKYIRHPMYVAVILVGWGGLLLYLTWTMLGSAIMMFGLIYRAMREDQALAQEFGSDWEEYQNRVPGWIPRISRIP
jgi:protein-S-isoprenylcysteine O-methyltransferase Ste14